MAVFGYNEAVYGALCYIYGDDDRELSVQEQLGIRTHFLERHYLSNESMEAISYRWSQGPSDFYWDVINSLNDCSLTQRLEAYKTICIVINDFSASRNDRWDPANRIREDMGISTDEYNRYIGK